MELFLIWKRGGGGGLNMSIFFGRANSKRFGYVPIDRVVGCCLPLTYEVRFGGRSLLARMEER